MHTALTPHSLWRNARYITWLVSDTSKGLAAALFGFALPLLALIVTNDPVQAGIIGAVGIAVRTLTTLAGGVFADRHSRIALMIAGAATGVILSAAFTALAVASALTFATLLVVDILLAARSGLFDVAGESALKEIVPSDAMGRAQAANQGRDAALQLVGGPLVGVLLAAGGWLIGIAMTFAHAFSAITAWLLRGGAVVTAPHTKIEIADATPRATQQPHALAEIREGFSWLLSRVDLRGILFVSTIINLGFNAAITTVIFSLQQQGESPVTIGVISAALGATMLTGALGAPFLVTRVPAGALALTGLLVATAGIFALIVVVPVWGVTIVLAASVLLLPSLNAALMGYFMVAVPTELLGRANSASMVLSIGAMPLGPLIAGFGLGLVGRGGTIAVCAALCVAAALLALSNGGLRALPAEGGWHSHAQKFSVR